MSRMRRKNERQSARDASPWSARERLGMAAWRAVEVLLCRPSPKRVNGWRLFWLRLFGCHVRGAPLVHPTAIIKIPWQLSIDDGAAIGEHVEIYNLGHVTLGELCVLGPHAYLCGGSHDLTIPLLPLTVGDIVVGRDAFIGARAMLLPGVTVGEGAVIGAGAVVSRDMPPWTVCAGNPCRPLKPRDRSQWADS
jgi:putative colanic acid biosynthesis acetyltransferase WcaF